MSEEAREAFAMAEQRLKNQLIATYRTIEKTIGGENHISERWQNEWLEIGAELRKAADLIDQIKLWLKK